MAEPDDERLDSVFRVEEDRVPPDDMSSAFRTLLDRDDSESVLVAYFVDYVRSGRVKFLFALRYPVRSLRMVAAIRRLDVLELSPSGSADGRLIEHSLRRPMLVRLVFSGVAAAVRIPENPADYVDGHAMQRLRRELRKADRGGVRYRLVADPGERRALLAAADRHESGGAVDSFRNASPQNDDVLDLAVWLLGEDAERRTLVLAGIAVDGPVALLRYYRTLSNDSLASTARFAAMPVLIDHLHMLGVTHLVDPGRPYWLHNGVRMFQRQVGFHLLRTRVRPTLEPRRS